MKITHSKLRRIIQEEISRVIEAADTDGDGTPDYRDSDSDNDGISDADEGVDDPAELLRRRDELHDTYGSDWYMLKSIDRGPGYLDDDVYERLISTRDESRDYREFFDKVARKFDRVTGRHMSDNEFGLQPSTARAVYDKRAGHSLRDVKDAWKEYTELSKLFRTDPSQSTGDRTGRKVSKTVHIPTGKVVSARVDRKGYRRR